MSADRDKCSTTNVALAHQYTSYLHDYDDHPYGSQHVLVVIKPFFYFLKAALDGRTHEEKLNQSPVCLKAV